MKALSVMLGLIFAAGFIHQAVGKACDTELKKKNSNIL
jgi:hypothetical protein